MPVACRSTGSQLASGTPQFISLKIKPISLTFSHSRKPRVGRSYIVKRPVVRSNIAIWFDSATVNQTRSFASTRIVCG